MLVAQASGGVREACACGDRFLFAPVADVVSTP